jgi:hypothetical protein
MVAVSCPAVFLHQGAPGEKMKIHHEPLNRFFMLISGAHLLLRT